MQRPDSETRAKDLYEAAGYEVYMPPIAKFREQDVFGLFDLLCFGHGRLECVQVKGGKKASGIIDWFDKASLYEEHLSDMRVTFLHRKEGAWRLARSTRDGYTWVHDGREDSDDDYPDLEELLQR